MKSYEKITRERLENFINNFSERRLEGATSDYRNIIFKVSFDKEAKIDILFLSHNYAYDRKYNFIPKDFEFLGVVCNKTKNILMSSYYLNELIKETESSLNITYITNICNISEDVSKELTKKIKVFWDKIKKEAENQTYYNDEHTKKYRAREKAEEWFVNDNLITAPEYSYNIQIDTKEDLLLEYYINKEKVLRELVSHYFEERKESIYKSILCYEEASKILPTLLNNKGLQVEKAIKEALKDLDCNMVTVKASKETPEGIKYGFWEGKVELFSLQRCKANTWIPVWKTPLSERKEFFKLFGKDADLFPEDIDEITFRKKTLYKKGE